MKSKPDYPLMFFTTSEEWEEWLSKNHQTADGVWLKFAKKDSGVTSVNYAEALDVALCYGWIDGLHAASTPHIISKSSRRAATKACGRSATSTRWPN